MKFGFCALWLSVCPMALGASSFDVDASLNERAKWRSFGVENWTEFDPVERAFASRRPVRVDAWDWPANAGTIGQLKSLIAHAEAGRKGYDAVHVSARVKPGKRPTQMTLGQIRTWIRNTPGQPHAIGRYQIIPSTLRSLVARAKLPNSTVFSPQVQDQLADLLLADAGLADFQRGRISRVKFMNRLALIWAGLPQSNGRSAYHGYAGNRATISLRFYKAQMNKIFRN